MRTVRGEFLVEGSALGEAGRVTLIGRCGDRPIKVGDRFNYLYRYRPRAYPRGFEQPSEVEQVVPLALTIASIRACGRDLVELPIGWTGALDCETQPTDLIPKGWAIGTEDPRTTDDAAAAVPADHTGRT